MVPIGPHWFLFIPIALWTSEIPRCKMSGSNLDMATSSLRSSTFTAKITFGTKIWFLQVREEFQLRPLFRHNFCVIDLSVHSKMSKTHSETSEEYEFIETPAAPTPTPPVEDCGVRTTSVQKFIQ